MASIRTNAACLRTVTELKPRDFADCPEIGPSQPRALGVAIREFLADKEIGVALANLLNAVTDFLAAKPSAPEVHRSADAVANRMLDRRLQ
jgi:putative DNA methylase